MPAVTAGRSRHAWSYPSAEYVRLYADVADAVPRITDYWTDFYVRRLDSASTMRALALAYSE